MARHARRNQSLTASQFQKGVVKDHERHHMPIYLHNTMMVDYNDGKLVYEQCMV
jgi:hypothetical protein